MKILSYSPVGYQGDMIEVEVDIRKGIPGVDIVGIPDLAVKEAKERVRIAIKNCGFEFPKQRIVVNLAPADIKKVGAGFDLPIALGILTVSGQIPQVSKQIMAFGELSLTGSLRWVPSVFASVMGAKEQGISEFIVPSLNLKEVSFLTGLHLWPLEHLTQLPELLDKINQQKYQNWSIPPLDWQPYYEKQLDFAELNGQEYLKRALEVAACGGHNVMLAGPPGSGKTMSAKRIQTILPPMEPQEVIQATRIWSVAAKLNWQESIIMHRPVRMPHHSASMEGLIGGGTNIRPGEISLAHTGVLILDEVLEFKKSLLQSLREPLEDGHVSIVRAGRSYQFPSDCQLVITSNLCPCGNLGKEQSICICSMNEIQNYWKKLGGALLDRIDIRVKVTAIDTKKLLDWPQTSSATMAERVKRAREKQSKRYQNIDHIFSNAQLGPKEVKLYCPLSLNLQTLLVNILNKLNLSSRATHSILKVARSIADLNDHNDIEKNDLLEAIEHRRYGDDLTQL